MSTSLAEIRTGLRQVQISCGHGHRPLWSRQLVSVGRIRGERYMDASHTLVRRSALESGSSIADYTYALNGGIEVYLLEQTPATWRRWSSLGRPAGDARPQCDY